MFGIICAIISGIAMSLQGVFNTRLGDKIGTWETTVIVQAIALVLSLIISAIFGHGSYSNLKDVSKIYLLGGVTWRCDNIYSNEKCQFNGSYFRNRYNTNSSIVYCCSY